MASPIHPTRGDVYVTGETYSNDLPGAAQGSQAARGGGDDGFLARLDPKLTHFIQTTYLGGSGDDIPAAIAIQPQGGQVLVAGMTTSPDLPGAAGGSQPGYAGGDDFFGGDGFVTRFPAGLSAGEQHLVRPTPTTLCLSGRRFAVRVTWRVPSTGKSGAGTAVSLGADTGYFWFFDDANIELVVKVLDARGGQRPLLGLLRRAFGRRVHDHRHRHDDGRRQDVRQPVRHPRHRSPTRRPSRTPPGLPAPEAFRVGGHRRRRSRARSAAELYALYAALTQTRPSRRPHAGPCAAGGATLCLNQARFQVSRRLGRAEPGQVGPRARPSRSPPTPGTSGSSTRPTSSSWSRCSTGEASTAQFWVFYGALSNVQYTITVTDTQTGTVKTYDNASGTLASVADTSAF